MFASKTSRKAALVPTIKHIWSTQQRNSSRSCGLVGMPNVGKSTLFNALTETQKAEAANYPFCTIEPNKGIVAVPDVRLEQLATMAKTKRTVGTQIEFIDIAGLVKGASKGQGLGNQFLSNIRACNQIVQVVRCFRDDNIIHVEKDVNPLRDIDIINSELIFADLETVNRMNAKSKKQPPEMKALLEQCEKVLYQSVPLYQFLKREKSKFTDVQLKEIKSWNLLSAKPVLYVCNVGEDDMKNGNDLTEQVKQFVAEQESKYKGKDENTEFGHDKVTVVCAKFESEASLIRDPAERLSMLNAFGLEQTGLQQIIKSSYDQLGLITYYTVGEKETRAWTIRQGTTAPQAAGEIHTDIEKGFVKAEVIGWKDYLDCNCDDKIAKKKNKMRSEGKDYIVQDGDCLYFHRRNT